MLVYPIPLDNQRAHGGRHKQHSQCRGCAELVRPGRHGEYCERMQVMMCIVISYCYMYVRAHSLSQMYLNI